MSSVWCVSTRTPCGTPSACRVRGSCLTPPDTKIVTWTTPIMRAERCLHAAGEALEFHQRERALALLTEHLSHVRELVQFVQKYPSLNHEERKKP